jgi:hypothetical protein
MANDDIQGTITDEADNPIDGAPVALIRDEGDGGDDVVYTTTDANGDYLFEGHPQGDGTTQEWHVVAHFEDGSGSYNTYSKPNVSADLPEGGIIPPGTIDNFESADGSSTLGPYESGDDISTYYTGETGNYARQTNTVEAGSFAVKGSDDTGGDSYEIASTSGLPNYPSYEDEFSFHFNSSSGNSQARMYFGLQDLNNTYAVYTNYFGDDLTIQKVDGGNTTAVASKSVTYNTNEWYEAVVNWQDTITVTLYDNSDSEIASVSGSDSTFQSNTGIGFRIRGASGVTVDMFWDELKVL